ncbi:MAG: 3-oxoacyl-[acyl-carrier-protein] synthase III C-terminal domain-containing protein [Anaerolineae bacterium]|nr:3-oxoacyl-[acyl-carrier-protein] synthase III C-terminal domain-containing protein [Anaerolineae bacterium]
MASVLSVGTAVPEHVVWQTEAAAFALRHFNGRLAHHSQLMSVFPNTRIDKRHFVVPLSWFELSAHSLKERNDIYLSSAERLGEVAAQQALARAEVEPAEVDFIVFVSTTGLATPSLDARLIERLGLRRTARRLPIWGLGCAGGVAGLARAAEFTLAHPDSVALVVAVEICSITFQFHDFSKKNFIAASLFADGAAAAVIAGCNRLKQKPALRFLTSYSYLFPNSTHVMGWDIVDTGFSVVFAPEIPARIARDLRPVVEACLAEQGIPSSALHSYVLHPGGARVLDAYREAFNLSDEDLRLSSAVLREFGNMSSPTVLFVLERTLAQSKLSNGLVLMGALGPGFSAELALLEGC